MAMYIKDTLKASISGNAGTATKLATARTITVGNTGKTFDGSGNVSWTLAEIGAAASSHGTHVSYGGNGSATTVSRSDHTHTNIVHQDTRSVNTTPDGVPEGLSVHLKTSGTDGLSDGGNYHSSLFIKGWNDYSGGPYGNISISANNNLWFRSSSSGTAWNSWKKVSVDGHTHSYLPLSGGQLTGRLTLPSTATTTDTSAPTQLAYGLLGAYGTLKILANTDNAEGADNEYVHIAAARGLDPTTSQGITVYGTYANCFGRKISTEGHGHNEIWIKDAPFNSSNDTTSNWGGQGVSVSWYPDGTTITNKPNSWGFIFNIGRGTEVHQMWFSQATGTTYHRGGNGSGWSGSWRAMLDSDNFSSYAAPASHSHSYLSTGGGTLSGPIYVSGESRFHNGNYSDPWSGTGCAIKATGNIAATGIIKANGRMDIQGIPLSIQSGAPSCGGVWIQI